MFFVMVMLSTARNRNATTVAPIEYAQALYPESGRRSVLDRLGLWSVLAVILIVIAYAYPIASLLKLQRFGSPGFSPF